MISKFYGGKVKSSKTREFGFARIKKTKNSPLTVDFFNTKKTLYRSLLIYLYTVKRWIRKRRKQEKADMFV